MLASQSLKLSCLSCLTEFIYCFYIMYSSHTTKRNYTILVFKYTTYFSSPLSLFISHFFSLPVNHPTLFIRETPFLPLIPLSQKIIPWYLDYDGRTWTTNNLGGFPGGSVSKETTCNVGDPGSIPGPGRSPGEGNGNPLHYSCLGNAINGGTW